MNLTRIFRSSPLLNPQRLCFLKNQLFTTGGEKNSEVVQAKIQEVPVHLKPYDKQKYEVPSQKLKYSTGYALLDVEPMPRSKIMKICYNVLDKIKSIPEDAMYRIYTEEKIKYIMKLTDEIEDVQQLEQELGNDSIELFIQSLSKELDLVDYMKDSKPWEAVEQDEDEKEVYNFGKLRRSEKGIPKYQRIPRTDTNQKYLK